MDDVLAEFRHAHQVQNGYELASTISPVAPKGNAGRLYDFYRSSNNYSIQTDLRYAIIYNNDIQLNKVEGNAWLEVFAAYWRAIGEILLAEEYANQGKLEEAKWNTVYEAWKEVTNALIRGYSTGAFQSWTVPCLYVAGKYLRVFAIKADEQAAKTKGEVTFNAGFQDDVVGSLGKHEKLEDAARQLNRIFGLCISDRAPIEESRKWGLYYIANLLFKTYFKLNSIGLSKNIIRSIQASKTDMPPLEAYPKSHVVTFKYYTGVVSFLDEDYVKAEEDLTYSYRLCHPSLSPKNHSLVLTYLIPCHLLTTHTLPSSTLLRPYPHLQRLFLPLCAAIRRGDLAAFDAALAAGEDEFVKRRIYLTLERGRDVALRNLLRKVFISGGWEGGVTVGKDGVERKERRTRISVKEFQAALRLGGGGKEIESDEVECLIANMIYKGHIKGYIARERGIVVLSKGGQAFPGTGV